jgi:hypothetical protein
MQRARITVWPAGLSGLFQARLDSRRSGCAADEEGSAAGELSRPQRGRADV